MSYLGGDVPQHKPLEVGHVRLQISKPFAKMKFVPPSKLHGA